MFFRRTLFSSSSKESQQSNSVSKIQVKSIQDNLVRLKSDPVSSPKVRYITKTIFTADKPSASQDLKQQKKWQPRSSRHRASASWSTEGSNKKIQQNYADSSPSVNREENTTTLSVEIEHPEDEYNSSQKFSGALLTSPHISEHHEKEKLELSSPIVASASSNIITMFGQEEVEFGQDYSEEYESNSLAVIKKNVSFGIADSFSPPKEKRFSSLSSWSMTSSSTSSSSHSSRGIMKVRENRNEKEYQRFMKQQELISELLKQLRKGTNMIKHGSDGIPTKRFFFINQDGTELRWTHSSDHSRVYQSKAILLADVKSIVFGPRTPKFAKFDWINGKPYNCFSIIVENRERTLTLDMECETREDFMNFYFGIQALAPLSHKSLSRAQVNWYRSLYKSLQIAKKDKISASEVWRQLVFLANYPEEKDQECAWKQCTIQKSRLLQFQN